MSLIPANANRHSQPALGPGTPDVATAVGELYRACHLSPPDLAYAHDALAFGQAVRRLHRRDRTAWIFAPLMSGLLLSEAGASFRWAPELGLAAD